MVRKLGRVVARIASDDADLSPEGAFTRMATAVLAGLFGPPMLALPSDRLQWQIWGCLALVAPLVALAQAASRRSFALAGILGFAGAALGAVAAFGPQVGVFAGWLVLVPIETAIILAAAYSNFGGLFPLAVLFGLAIAERIGLTAARPDAMTAMIFAPPAAVCLSLGARYLDKVRRARLRRAWLRDQRSLPPSSEMHLWLDARARVLEVGEDLAEVLRVDDANLSGQGLLHRIHVTDRAEFMRAFEIALQSDETAVANARLKLADAQSLRMADEGGWLWFEARMRRLVGGARANSAAVVVALKDITEAKANERRFEILRNEAATAISLKDRLLANVSHELRTPLNAILGFSEILSDPRLAPASSDTRFEYAGIIHTSAQHLLSVVNLLLDMSKLEAGRYEIEPEPFEIGALVRNCVDMLRLKAEETGVTIDCSAIRASLELTADKRACRQILLNLLSNAVKFTPRGGHVAVEIEVAGENLEMTVVDTGIGISAEHLPRLGDPFFQARSGYDRASDGAGLGLALVRGLVGLHGGAVAIESAPGVGTRVTVRLPLEGQTPQDVSPAPPKFEIRSRLDWRRGSPGMIAIEERKIA
jgi:cell cycle sensor histidine kinase DivJ